MKTTNRIPGKQVAGFVYSPHWVTNPELIEEYVKLMKGFGFSLLIGFVRHMRENVLTPAVHDAVKKSAAIIHRHGLKFVLDTDPTWWGQELVERHPEAAMWMMKKAVTIAEDGNFSFELPFPLPQPYHGQQHIFHEITSLYKMRAGRATRLPARLFTYEWQHRGKNPKMTTLIAGKLKEKYSGQLIAYCALRDFYHADAAHPRYLEAQRQLVNMYKDVPLDGMGWDEPGKVLGDIGYKAGEGFFDFFRKRNGYDLKNELIYLDELNATVQAVKVRLDYYDTLSEMNFIAQDQHNRLAKKLFGKDIFLGTHQTWCGISGDLTAGMADYYRLGKVLSAAFVDTFWCCRPSNVSYNYLLGDGIRKELGFTDAYSNDWDRNSNVIARMQFYNRFKMLFNINWFGIWFSDYPEGEVNFRLPPIRDAVAPDVKKLDVFNRFISDDWYAQTDIAMWHGWEGIAYLPKLYIYSYSLFLENFSQGLVERGLYADFISTGAIDRVSIGKGVFTIDGRQYRVLIMPYAAVLPEKVYRKIMEMARRGVSVIFIGVPPQFSSDTGKSLYADFGDKVGFLPITLERYTSDYQRKYPTIESSVLDYHYPVKLTCGAAGRNEEDEIAYVKSPARQLYYFPVLDTWEEQFELIEPLVIHQVTGYSHRGYFRVYKNNRKPNELIIVAVSRMRSSLKSVFRIGDDRLLSVEGGTWCAIRLVDRRVVQWIGDAESVETGSNATMACVLKNGNLKSV